MNSKRGSSAVFLSVILAALMTITLALIYGVREETIRSRTDSIVNLAGDSILSEFDSYVQEEYGLFLIRGNDQELSGKLRKYILYTTGSMEDMDVQKVSASAGRFLLADTDLAREQILEHARFAQTQKLLSKAPSAGSAGDEKKTSERTFEMELRSYHSLQLIYQKGICVNWRSRSLIKKMGSMMCFRRAVKDS